MYLLIDNYDSFTYNLRALFSSCGAATEVVRNDRYVNAENYRGIIISPGPSCPGNAGTSNRYLHEYAGKKPFLGVCLGMQCIGSYLGYHVSRAPSVMHGKADRVRITSGDSVLFRGMPDSFQAVRYHSLAVYHEGRDVTSRADSDNSAMSIENKKMNLFGVQFHPESILSEYGMEIVMNFIKHSEVS